MKPRAKKPATAKPDAMTKLILAALRRARADAVKTARMHGTPIIYLHDGKIVREHP
jgi:hypothetical protein